MYDRKKDDLCNLIGNLSANCSNATDIDACKQKALFDYSAREMIRPLYGIMQNDMIAKQNFTNYCQFNHSEIFRNQSLDNVTKDFNYDFGDLGFILQ